MTDAGQVVSVQRDVERAKGDIDVLVAADRLVQPRGDEIAARADTDEGEG